MPYGFPFIKPCLIGGTMNKQTVRVWRRVNTYGIYFISVLTASVIAMSVCALGV
jgi:hypothetical protein